MVTKFKSINGKFIQLSSSSIYEPEFDGSDYESDNDKVRLTGQLHNIYELIKDGSWRTLKEIAEKTGYGESSISSQLRNLRKDRFGNHDIRKRHRGDRKNGLFEYRLILTEME